MRTDVIKDAVQARGFYDIPLYEEGEEKPVYYDLFNWTHGYGLVSGDGLGQRSSFQGLLNEMLFNTIERKIAYIQGVFEDLSEGSGITSGKNQLYFANSYTKVERCKRWISEIADYMGFKNATGIVINHKIEYYIPMCHILTIEPKVVKFIQNFRLDLDI